MLVLSILFRLLRSYASGTMTERCVLLLFSFFLILAADTHLHREKRELMRQVPLIGPDGKPGTRVLGPALSEKIYRLFTSMNPDEVL